MGFTLPLWTGGVYTNPVRQIISAAKDHHRLDGVNLLSLRLAYALAGFLDHTGEVLPVVLVPVPSTKEAVRTRGLDFTLELTKKASIHLGRIGVDTRVAPVLSHTRSTMDQGNLTTAARFANLHESLQASRFPLEGNVMITDDVVTTGASLTEAYRALDQAGYQVVGASTIAATQLRSSPPQGPLS
ncbi:MAG: hypothetical protein FWG15_01180 [Propionibacteriaceae bacterium]|nr:hypothetical protein [Propionibacteriaceae bacterium]